jgi:hypothetical protein
MTPEIKDAANDSCQEPLVNIHVGDEYIGVYVCSCSASHDCIFRPRDRPTFIIDLLVVVE